MATCFKNFRFILNKHVQNGIEPDWKNEFQNQMRYWTNSKNASSRGRPRKRAEGIRKTPQRTYTHIGSAHVGT
jgi:hypothetical protein